VEHKRDHCRVCGQKIQFITRDALRRVHHPIHYVLVEKGKVSGLACSKECVWSYCREHGYKVTVYPVDVEAMLRYNEHRCKDSKS